jgi:hypothetical protein
MCQAVVRLHSRCIIRFVSSGGESQQFFAHPPPFPPGMIRKEWVKLSAMTGLLRQIEVFLDGQGIIVHRWALQKLLSICVNRNKQVGFP